MKILFLPNWEVTYLEQDTELIPPPNKIVKDQPYWFFKYFPKHSVQVDLIDYQKKNFFHFFERNYIKVYLTQSVKALVHDRNYDFVISHGAQSGLFYSFLRSLSFRKSPKHIIFDIGSFNGGRSGILEIFLIKLALIRSKPILVYHASIQENYYKRYFPDLMRIYIPFGIDTNFFIPLDSNGGNYVLSFGKIKRDYDTLIHAWNKLGSNIHLKIIGVSDIDTLYNPNIEILPRCSIQELKNAVAGSKFVIIPLPDLPYANGQTSVLQAMAMGKTVIVSKTQGIKDYIIDGSGAFYVEPYNSNDIVDKVNTLLDNEMLIKDSDRKAREYVVNNFSEELMGKYLYEYLISL